MRGGLGVSWNGALILGSRQGGDFVCDLILQYELLVEIF